MVGICLVGRTESWPSESVDEGRTLSIICHPRLFLGLYFGFEAMMNLLRGWYFSKLHDARARLPTQSRNLIASTPEPGLAQCTCGPDPE